MGSDQYDWKIHLLGRPAAGTPHSAIGDWSPGAERGGLLYMDSAGALVGAVTVNWAKADRDLRGALAAGGKPAEVAHLS